MMKLVVCVFAGAITLSSSLQASRAALRGAVECAALPRRELIAAGGAGLVGLFAAGPAGAANINNVEKTLSGMGLPAIGDVPDGFNALLETYSQNRAKPLLVRFAFPRGWLVVKPSTNTNGESGTISAGDYGKADSATFFDFGEKGDVSSKEFVKKVILAGISLRGDNQYQSFKVGAVKPKNADGYVTADFSYESLTGAGFIIERKGVASVGSVGPGTAALLAITTSARWKKLETNYRAIVGSFRVYETTAAAVQAITEDN